MDWLRASCGTIWCLPGCQDRCHQHPAVQVEAVEDLTNDTRKNEMTGIREYWRWAMGKRVHSSVTKTPLPGREPLSRRQDASGHMGSACVANCLPVVSVTG